VYSYIHRYWFVFCGFGDFITTLDLGCWCALCYCLAFCTSWSSMMDSGFSEAEWFWPLHIENRKNLFGDIRLWFGAYYWFCSPWSAWVILA